VKICCNEVESDEYVACTIECECGSVFSPVLRLLMAKHRPATLWRLPGWQSVWCQIRGHSFQFPGVCRTGKAQI